MLLLAQKDNEIMRKGGINSYLKAGSAIVSCKAHVVSVTPLDSACVGQKQPWVFSKGTGNALFQENFIYKHRQGAGFGPQP